MNTKIKSIGNKWKKKDKEAMRKLEGYREEEKKFMMKENKNTKLKDL